MERKGTLRLGWVVEQSMWQLVVSHRNCDRQRLLRRSAPRNDLLFVIASGAKQSHRVTTLLTCQNSCGHPLVVFLAIATVLIFARPGNTAIDYSPWNTLLTRYVDDNGRVAYRDLQANDRTVLAGYLATLAQAQVAGMSEAEEKAFWINAYNAAIINGVLQGYTAENVLARKRFFSWYTLPVAGEQRSPDEIEHQILRKKFHDPRIHFAIVCASSSCPKLRREAYVPERLDQQLDEAARVFINDPMRNRIDAQQVVLSQLFQWFAEDFVRNAGSVPAFVQRFVADDKSAILNAKSNELRYLEYNWTLNAQEGQRVS
jgi:hypothetical protein